jgi:type I restriction-modification system DNA methylase subunit
MITSPNSLAGGYSAVYAALADLRETFHRSGRLDDSNAKLDEVAKLFATYLAYRRGLIPTFPAVDSQQLVTELQLAFETAAHLPQYVWSKSGRSIFGTQPKLILRDEDKSLARDLTSLVRQCVDLAYQLRDDGRPFDILNEAFGHFVRDNFRGNVEDAQYMTPPEAVDFMVDMVIDDISQEISENPNKHLTVLDPSCGVGSFLTTFYHRARAASNIPLEKVRLIGQDKVERMARLATINLELFDVEEHRIEIGNSLERGSALDELNGKVDLILTNPPFGARFSGDEVRTSCGENTPFFSSLRRTIPSIDSELLFIDRNLELLRDGGRLLIVVPDGVVSAKGTAALLRQYLSCKATLKAVIELPAVTFAQAGTRTKTSIVYIQKGRKKSPANTFMSVASDLGFQVSSRKGVQIKQSEGENQLYKILLAYRNTEEADLTSGATVLNRTPSCVLVEESEVLRGSWTPSHYSAERLDAIAEVQSRSGLRMVPLSELVEFCADERRNERWQSGTAFISVLHVLGEGLVDMAGAQTYSPKTPGIPTHSGEILVSRINPRIPRICVTPEFGKRTLCSSEFEVLRPKPGVDIYLLAYLLLTDAVQSQIRSLTSGTSASHNRIRTAELASVLVPMPDRGSSRAAQLSTLADEYRSALQAMSEASVKVAALRASELTLLG